MGKLEVAGGGGGHEGEVGEAVAELGGDKGIVGGVLA